MAVSCSISMLARSGGHFNPSSILQHKTPDAEQKASFVRLLTQKAEAVLTHVRSD